MTIQPLWLVEMIKSLKYGIQLQDGQTNIQAQVMEMLFGNANLILMGRWQLG